VGKNGGNSLGAPSPSLPNDREEVGQLILVVTAVDAERDAVVRDLGAPVEIEIGNRVGRAVETPAGTLHAFSGGVGPVAAAVSTAHLLAADPTYELIVCAGIAGGFRGRVEVGGVVIASYTTFADLGVRTDDGFLTLRDMGLHQDSSLAIEGGPITDRLERGAAGAVRGEILTLACMTGTQADADVLANRHPRALAEAMEGFGVVAAARQAANFSGRIMEIRAISNLIGRRDRSSWNMPGAFDALSRTFAELVKEPLP
jgi:futalosine hydrolase